MLAIRSFARSFALWLVLLASPVFAQETPAPESPEAIKAAIAQHTVGIAEADSVKDIATAIRLRMALAQLSKPKEAQVLYEQAVHLADSADRTEEELAARKALAQTLSGRGQVKQAYDEAMHAVEKSAEWLSQQAESSGAKEGEIRRLAALERDSLSALADAGRRDAENRINEANEDAEFWMLVGLGTVALALIAVVIVLFMNGRALRRQRDEIQGLRADLGSLIDREQNRKREPTANVVIAPPTVTPAQTPIADTVAPPVAVDPVVQAMFRKQAPERLATLRDARSHGDHEKVQRVVHTLKPQLVNFDPALAHLCARITEPGAQNDAQRWNADVDAFEQAVSRLLA